MNLFVIYIHTYHCVRGTCNIYQFIFMERSSFSEEFTDFIGDVMLATGQPVQARSGKGMATFVYTEMIKQLEVFLH